MAVQSRRRDDLDGGAEPAHTIAAYTASPDRTVFTESGNSDGWIATDLTVDLQR